MPTALKAVIEACPHGLRLCSGADVLYENAAWGRLQDAKSRVLTGAAEFREESLRVSLNEEPIDLCVIQDVTDRSRLEAQLREAQKLESLGRWVGSIVHDFRNVLTAVMLYSDLLGQTAEPGSVAAKYNAEVRGAAQRGADLVGQLLSFARQRAPEVTVLSLNSLLNGIRDVLKRMIGEDIEVVFDLCESPCSACVDATQMQQVVFNLAVNARQAMPEGGRMILRTREMAEEELSGTGGWVELIVSDNGVGMGKDTLARAFEPFFTTKPKGKGTGLGLTTVQSIVTQYGGSVSIDSKPAQGTTVQILLPRIELAQDDRASEASTEAPAGSETILLVEDDSFVRASMSEMLNRCGYRVIQAHSGLEAIRLAEDFDGRIDLLLTDMVLPGLSGRQIAHRLKLNRPDLRIIFISGYEPDPADAGPDFLSKPFSKQVLAQKVREVLDSPGAGSAARA